MIELTDIFRPHVILTSVVGALSLTILSFVLRSLSVDGELTTVRVFIIRIAMVSLFIHMLTIVTPRLQLVGFILCLLCYPMAISWAWFRKLAVWDKIEPYYDVKDALWTALPKWLSGVRAHAQSSTTREPECDQQRYLLGMVGKAGIARTDLRPVGYVVIDRAEYLGKAYGGYISANTAIRVIDVRNAELVVDLIQQDG